MFETVVVPLDRSEHAEAALAPAVAVAQRESAALVLVSVASDPDAVSGAATYLDAVAKRLPVRAARRAEVGVEEGAAKIITRLVAESSAPLLCMTTHGRSGIGYAVLGSVAEQILRDLASPALLVGPSAAGNAEPGGGPVLLCLDGSDFSERMVPVAVEWAATFERPLWLVSVLTAELRELDDEGHGSDVLETNYLARWARRIGQTGGPVDWDVLHGDDATAAIVDYVPDRDASLIALATHGRTGLRRIAAGSVAMQVAHRAACPVLVMRPPHAESNP